MDDILLARHLTSLGATIGLAEDGVVRYHVDPSRLSRGDWIKGAVRLGRSLAYVAHHWEHTQISLAATAPIAKAGRIGFGAKGKANLDPG